MIPHQIENFNKNFINYLLNNDLNIGDLNQFEVKYYKLLFFFHMKSNTFELIGNDGQTKHKITVSIDHIHNAIIKVGAVMDKPIQYYIKASKTNAIDEYKHKARQQEILKNNVNNIFEVLQCDLSVMYKFTEHEQILVNELIDGVARKYSAIHRDKYDYVFNSVKTKLYKNF